MSNGNNPGKQPTRRPNNQSSVGIQQARRVGRARAPFQWSDIPASDVGELIQLVAGQGAAIICGVTSDGGALSITILDGDERLRDWPSNIDEYSSFVDWARDTFAVR